MFILDWSEVLPSAVHDLSPLHRKIVEYVANLPGNRKPSISHAVQTWDLNRDEFTYELDVALTRIRANLRRSGIHKFSDLDIS